MAEVKTEFTGDSSSLVSATKAAQQGINGVLETTGKAAGVLGQFNQVLELGEKASKASAKAQLALAAASNVASFSASGMGMAVKSLSASLLSSPLLPFAAALVIVGVAINTVTSLLDAETEAMERNTKARKESSDAISDVLKELDSVTKGTADYSLRLQEAQGSLDSLDVAHKKERESLNENYEASQDVANAAVLVAKANLAEAQSHKDNEVAVRAATTALEGARKAKDDLNNAYVISSHTLDEAQKAERKQKDAADATAEADKRRAAAAKKKAKEDAAAAKALRDWIEIQDHAREAIAAAIAVRKKETTATEDLHEEILALGRTERENILQAGRDLQDKVSRQVAANKELGLGTEELEKDRLLIWADTDKKLRAYDKAQADSAKDKDKKIFESAEDAAEKIMGVMGGIANQAADVAGEFADRFADAYTETADQLSEIDGLLEDLADSSTDYSKMQGEALVEAYKDGKIAASELSSSQKKYLKSTLEAEEAALKKKAAAEKKAAEDAFKVTQAVAIIQAIMGTAAGIMQAYGQLGPIGGTIAGIAITALGATQVGLIATQKPSFARGGFTDNVPTTGGNATLHPREAVLNQTGRAVMGDDAIQAANAGVYGQSQRPGQGTIVYKHKAFNYFIADHLRMNGSLARSIRKGDRIGQRRRGRGGGR